MFWKLFKKKESLEAQCIETMKKLDVKEGDLLVMNCPCFLSEETAHNLKNALQTAIKVTGCNIHIILLEDGVTIEKKWKA